jgi:threonine synthase
MIFEDFPDEIQPFLIPKTDGMLCYQCLDCGREHHIEELHYTCPACDQVLLIVDRSFERLKKIPADRWRRIFDFRRMLNIPSLKGIYRFHEFLGPIIPLESIVYLGEGHTPLVEANPLLKEMVGASFYFKNDGQNPSASFKDRGMASALSYIHYLIQRGLLSEVLAICASTGDTSAAAALYGSYLQPEIKSAVLLPHKKVTPQQLAQPLGSGAAVFEIPGVFDDCMKVVEALSEQYAVALLNSKNAWRILGQESYSYEIAQDFEYGMQKKVIALPIGNAGNITAVMSGFLKFFKTGVITALPKILGVQSEHANPVYKYYLEKDIKKRRFVPVNVKPSVAQAAMIGNPVSMPRVIHLVKEYNRLSDRQNVFVVEVDEQSIMDWELLANRNGHVACTHGGESLAGLKKAIENNIVASDEVAIIDSTAHALKFSGFQDMYYNNSFPDEFEITPNPKLINAPVYVHPQDLETVPSPGHPLDENELNKFVQRVSEEIAKALDLRKIHENE